MNPSDLCRKDHEDIIELNKRMKPEERLIAYFNHSESLYQIYQAGVNYRSHFSSKEKKS